MAAIDAASAQARAHAWRLTGYNAPDRHSSAQRPLVIDVDATLVTAHSDKELARATFKRGYGFHPLCAFVDHGADGSGEPLAVILRPQLESPQRSSACRRTLVKRLARGFHRRVAWVRVDQLKGAPGQQGCDLSMATFVRVEEHLSGEEA